MLRSRWGIGVLVYSAFVIALTAFPQTAWAQGAFGHTIPIKLPKGAGGIQPDLALTYNSNAGNGIVGVGWDLSGLSYITRVSYGDGIRYAGADMYAHSQLGVLVRQSDGTYRSLKESFAKFVPSGSCGDGPCQWMAYDRSGLRFSYGSSSGSRLAKDSSSANVRRWAVDSVRDVFGNSYEVTYVNDSPGGYPCLYPSVITYTKGSGLSVYRTVELAYESRHDTERAYTQGTKDEMRYRLKWIRVKANGQIVRAYRLDYASDTGSETGRSELVLTCPPDLDGYRCEPG